ncbi:MAG: hypothetical protein K0S61_374 [Anaerocolumna sp.]|nr:hypothetical protein [Anaerocolumna sp.]
MKRKKDSFKFSGRSHSVKGLISVSLAVVSLLSIVISSIISAITHGNGSMVLGAVGIIAFIVSLVGFILGIKGSLEKEIYYTAPIVGMIINGMLFLFYFVLYVVGIFL